MADDFRTSVELGLSLSKRIYYGNNPSLKPPKQVAPPDKSSEEEMIPAAPMVYAVVKDPGIIDNPDIPSYQPYVHGRCKPPALVPLHMYGIDVAVECCLDTAFVTVTGNWRLHCVAGTKSCDCRFAAPMGYQGSVLGFEVETTNGLYHTQLVKVDDSAYLDNLVKAEYGGFLKPNIFTLKIPKIVGGSKLKVKARWSQRLIYHEGRFSLNLPFTFPAFVTPPGKCPIRERIQLNLNSATSTEVLCKSDSHPLKELTCQVGKISFIYEADVYTWSQADFEFTYSVSSSDIHGGILFQSPSPNDFDQRKLFALYLFPGESQSRKEFRKSVVFLVDISGSMKGAPIESVKKALLGSLSKLNHDDFFNIIAFNKEIHLFSSSMELKTQESLRQVSEWMNLKLIADGDTDILVPMNKALEMVSHESHSMSLIFLITDGAVENERDVCNLVKDYNSNRDGLPLPRISTFGIGYYCNHYFLQMLAQIGRGHYAAAYDTDSVSSQLQRLYTMSSSVILSNIEVHCLNHVKSLQLYPPAIKDLTYGCPVIISGRFQGNLPDSVSISGTLAEMTNFSTELKVLEAKDIPLDKVFAQTQIDALTAEAWFTVNKELEKQIAEISMQTGFPSEYSRMILVFPDPADQRPDSITIQGKDVYDTAGLRKMISSRKIIPLASLGVGFGDVKKTGENLPPGVIIKAPDATELILQTATGCCHSLLDRFCCMCCIRAISTLSDQCVITVSQICAALACFECVDCCYDLCANCG